MKNNHMPKASQFTQCQRVEGGRPPGKWSGIRKDADAASHFALAGDHARSLYANAEALAQFQAALALGHPETCRLHEAIGDMHTLLAAYTASLASYEVAAALCEPGSPALAEIEHKLGNVHARRGEWLSAEAHFSAASDILGRPEFPAAVGRILADWSLGVHAQGQPERALSLARDALFLTESASDQPGMAQAHNILGILARSRGDAAGAAAHLEQSLAIAEALPDPNSRVAALNNLALARVRTAATCWGPRPWPSKRWRWELPWATGIGRPHCAIIWRTSSTQPVAAKRRWLSSSKVW